MVSPCDAEVTKIWVIHEWWELVWKHNKKVSIKRLFGDSLEHFCGYRYMSLYLRPNNRHFFVAPCDGTVSYMHVANGRARLRGMMALETIGIPTFKHFVEHHAAISSIIDFWASKIWVCALWSVNVNRIHMDIGVHDIVHKWDKIWHFLLWSCILLLIPHTFELLVSEWDKITIGREICVMSI